MGSEYTFAHAADLAACLPSESITARAQGAWTDSEWLLWSIEYSLRVLRWQNSKDGHSGRNAPRPLPTPADEQRVRDKLDNTDMRRIAEALGIDTEEV